jgi:hypothetical protein
LIEKENKSSNVKSVKICGTNIAITNNTIFYRRHLSEEEIIMICTLLVEKNSIRAIERITGHHRDRISDLISDMATTLPGRY